MCWSTVKKVFRVGRVVTVAFRRYIFLSPILFYLYVYSTCFDLHPTQHRKRLAIIIICAVYYFYTPHCTTQWYARMTAVGLLCTIVVFDFSTCRKFRNQFTSMYTLRVQLVHVAVWHCTYKYESGESSKMINSEKTTFPEVYLHAGSHGSMKMKTPKTYDNNNTISDDNSRL